MALLLGSLVLTIWVEARWSWGLFQFAVFAWAAAWAMRQLRHPTPVQSRLWLVPLSAVPLWGILQLLTHHTVYRWATWNAALSWTTYLVLFFLALQLFHQPAARNWFLHFALYFGFALSIIATLQMFTSGGKIYWFFPSGYQETVMGPFVYRNQYAAFMEMIFPIALWEALRDRRRPLLNFLTAASIFASVVASGSRAGSMLMISEALAVLFLTWSRGLLSGGTVARGFAKFVAIGLVLTAIVGWQFLWERYKQPDPYGLRRELLYSSLAMIRDRPGMGVGLGNWPRAYPAYALFDDGSYVNQAHNDWAQWTAEGGVPFLLFLLSLTLLAAPYAIRSIWGIGLLAVWVHCLVEYPFQQRPGLGAWFFLFLGILATVPARGDCDRIRNSGL
jgi:O-antigen ligase